MPRMIRTAAAPESQRYRPVPHPRLRFPIENHAAARRVIRSRKKPKARFRPVQAFPAPYLHRIRYIAIAV